MTDHRIATRSRVHEAAQEGGPIKLLVQEADEVARRFEFLASRIPYRAVAPKVVKHTVADLSRALAGATWKRVSEEVPSYRFAEDLGRRYRDTGASLTSLLLHWQILRRAIHLVLADHDVRTGEGALPILQEMTLMNYAIDWATEASLVGYVLPASVEG